MDELPWQTNAEWLLEQGALRNARKMLRVLLEDRFQQVPPELVQRIEAEENLERLAECFRQVLTINSPKEIPL